MLSQVAAAAVTEEVSLIAVPAKIPKASPDIVENPRKLPNGGNKIADIHFIFYDQDPMPITHFFLPPCLR